MAPGPTRWLDIPSARCLHNADSVGAGMFPNLFEATKTVVYYESIKRELKIKPIYECRCDERLQTKTTRITRLSYTGLVVELEHLKIETRLIDEKFANAMGEYVTQR